MLRLQELDDALDEIEPSSNGSKLLKVRKALETEYEQNFSNMIDKEDLKLLKYYFTKILDAANSCEPNP